MDPYFYNPSPVQHANVQQLLPSDPQMMRNSVVQSIGPAQVCVESPGVPVSQTAPHHHHHQHQGPINHSVDHQHQPVTLPPNPYGHQGSPHQPHPHQHHHPHGPPSMGGPHRPTGPQHHPPHPHSHVPPPSHHPIHPHAAPHGPHPPPPHPSPHAPMGVPPPQQHGALPPPPSHGMPSGPPMQALHNTVPHKVAGGPFVSRHSPYYSHSGIPQTEYRILEMNKRLHSRPLPRQSLSPMPNHQADESLWWERFACDFFDDDATLTISLHLDDRPHRYTIGRTLIPRFFRSFFEGGVIDLQYNLRHPKESFHPTHISLDCDRTTIVTHHQIKSQGPQHAPPTTVVVCTDGHLTLDFINNGPDLMIRAWNFATRACREYFERQGSMSGMSNNISVMGGPLPAHLNRNITRQGLTNSTINYLRMCEILEPMQDLMYEYKQSGLDPKSCLRNILFSRWKITVGNDARPPANKRRKRSKTSAAAGGAVGTNKKSKANANNNNNAANNCVTMSPSGPQGFSLASQDVMVVGEPSLMGGDFGDDNERVITRMENAQYDPSASLPNNTNENQANDGQIPPPVGTPNRVVSVNGPSDRSPCTVQQSSDQQQQSSQPQHPQQSSTPQQQQQAPNLGPPQQPNQCQQQSSIQQPLTPNQQQHPTSQAPAQHQAQQAKQVPASIQPPQSQAQTSIQQAPPAPPQQKRLVDMT